MLTRTSSVLVVSVARIGDTLLATPCLRALRRASGWIEVLAHPRRLEVLEHLEFIDELGGITKRSAPFRGHFQRRRFEAAICYGRDAQLLRFCVRAARQVVAFDYPEFHAAASPGLLRVPVPAESSLHAVRERFLLAEALGVTGDDLRLAYTVTNEEQARAEAWVRRNIPQGAGPLIGLQPFSFPTKAHRDWPLGHFVDLAKRLAQCHPHSHIIVLGDEDARARATVFASELPGRCTIAAGTLRLRQSAALMQRLDLYVGVDTGPTHIAGALGIPMVALYHAAYIGRYLMPLQNPRCAVIEHPATFSHDASRASMADIRVDQVWESAQGLLTGGSREQSSRCPGHGAEMIR